MAETHGLRLSHDEIATLWVQMGGRRGAGGKIADMAAAIALAESGGDITATGPNDNGSVDRGLFQINSIHGPLSTYQLSKNIKAAILISANGTNWRPWCTAWSDNACGSKGGSFKGAGASYKAFITGGYTPQDISIKTATDGSEVVVNSKGDNIVNTDAKSYDEGAGGNAEPGLHVGNPLSWYKALAALLTNLLSGEWWRRVGQGAAGIVLMALGLGLMLRKDVAAFVPTARIASAVKGMGKAA